MAEQPFPLPLTDGDGIGFLSLFLENWCDGNNNLQTKLQVSPPVYVSAPIRQTPPEGRAWSSPRHPCAGALLRPIFCCPYHLAHWSSHFFMASYPSNSPGQWIFLGKFILANICPSNINSYPIWKDVWKPWRQRPEKELCQGHLQRKATSFFSISIKVKITVYGSRRHFRQKMGFVKIYYHLCVSFYFH